MTRREEIVNNIGYQLTRAAVGFMEAHPFADSMDGFEAGAEWMQKKMIDKACEWLMLYGCEYATEEVMVEHFRKTMEE